mgnify:CR=1 FL=1
MNKKIYLSLALVLSLLLGSYAVPVLAENDKKHDDKHELRQEKEAKLMGSSFEVHITSNGKTLVRGAKVTAVTGSTITATSGWDSATLTWTITTDASTRFVGRHGGTSPLSEISVGDVISFQGALVTTVASPFTVKADTVKDWSSKIPFRTTLEGKAKTALSAVSLPATFVLTAGGVDYTVRVSTDTSVLNNRWLKLAFTSITAGDKVRVYGSVNSDNTVDATVVRDVSSE